VKLAQRNDNSYKTFCRSIAEVVQTSPFDSEFNSASNDNTFIHRTYFGKNVYLQSYSSCFEDKKSM